MCVYFSKTWRRNQIVNLQPCNSGKLLSPEEVVGITHELGHVRDPTNKQTNKQRQTWEFRVYGELRRLMGAVDTHFLGARWRCDRIYKLLSWQNHERPEEVDLMRFVAVQGMEGGRKQLYSGMCSQGQRSVGPQKIVNSCWDARTSPKTVLEVCPCLVSPKKLSPAKPSARARTFVKPRM